MRTVSGPPSYEQDSEGIAVFVELLRNFSVSNELVVRVQWILFTTAKMGN